MKKNMDQNNGWVKFHRKILDWEWFDDTNTFKLFFYLVLSANHEDNKWHGMTIKRGQLITSYSKLAERVGLTVRCVRVALNHLKTTNEVTHEGHRNYSVITILNYERYQTSDKPSDKRVTNERQTSDNKQELKNEKNVKNINIASSDAGEINQLIDSFSLVNPSYKVLFKNKTQRDSAGNLIKQYGLAKLLNLTSRLPQIMSDRYAPQITTPYELEAKMGKLLLHLKKPEVKKHSVKYL